MNDQPRCAVCGHPDKRDLGVSLAHWRDAPRGMAYEHVERCVDVTACRRRVELAKKPWPLVEQASDLRAS